MLNLREDLEMLSSSQCKSILLKNKCEMNKCEMSMSIHTGLRSLKYSQHSRTCWLNQKLVGVESHAISQLSQISN